MRSRSGSAELEAADAVIIWRAAWNENVSMGVDAARRGGAKIVFDVDDLMFDPDLARLDVIDGIRTQGLTEDAVRQYYSRVQSTMSQPICVWRRRMSSPSICAKPSSPLWYWPTGLIIATLTASRLAARRRQATKSDGLIRIGYAGGTRTHQRDFALCADAVAEICGSIPRCRLVAFRSDERPPAFLDIDEFPALRGLKEKSSGGTLSR